MSEFISTNSWYRAQRGANNYKPLIDYLLVSDLEKDRLRHLDETNLATELANSDIRFKIMPEYLTLFLFVLTFKEKFSKKVQGKNLSSGTKFLTNLESFSRRCALFVF